MLAVVYNKRLLYEYYTLVYNELCPENDQALQGEGVPTNVCCFEQKCRQCLWL